MTAFFDIYVFDCMTLIKIKMTEIDIDNYIFDLDTCKGKLMKNY